LPPAISGNVALGGLRPGAARIETWTTADTMPTRIDTLQVSPQGNLLIPISNLASDLAVKVQSLVGNLPPVTDLTVTITDSSAILRWNRMPGTASYRIYHSPNMEGLQNAPELIGETADSTFRDTGATAAASRRYYLVRVISH
jgi:hypothetical protein